MSLLWREEGMATLRSFHRGGYNLLEVGFILSHALIDLFGCALAGIAILFLEQAGDFI
jgi:hypothetical protein